MPLRPLRRIGVRSSPAGPSADRASGFRAKVSAIEAQPKALEVTTLRALSSMGSGSSTGAGLASALKIRSTEIRQRITELNFQAAGPAGQVLDPVRSRGEGNLDGIEASVCNAAPNYFWRRAMSIYGGSNEIQRNIVAKHVLGL
ncbi:acyl-CoA dehydrogenase family protein [Variovorax ureilyticus]|uniref:Acyl-CoA dehydrogenase family protein n=1 Tax=Variovorax ureilyticus TaxID=1836198 RepID=A0ABU8VAY8_9BURK